MSSPLADAATLNPIAAVPNDLPSPPLDHDLDLFVRRILDPEYHYSVSCITELVEDFLLRVRRLPKRIISCVELDIYFRAIYRFLSEKPEDERVDATFLRTFWEDYSLSSRQMAFDNVCEDLRLAEDEHRRAHEDYQIGRAHV